MPGSLVRARVVSLRQGPSYGVDDTSPDSGRLVSCVCVRQTARGIREREIPLLGAFLEGQITRNCGQPLVESPERKSRDTRRSQQVHVDPAQSAAIEMMAFHENQHFLMINHGRARQRFE